MRFALTRRVFTSHLIRLAAVTIAATIPALAMSSGAAAAGSHHRPKPTIVLVHGAWADSSSWSGEIARLQHDGYPVDAAPDPLRGLSSDTAYLKDFLNDRLRPDHPGRSLLRRRGHERCRDR